MPTVSWSAIHFNALAKEIRELFPMGNHRDELVERAVLTRLALSLAQRFEENNPRFDALKFLNACSPNTDLFPLSELWEF